MDTINIYLDLIEYFRWPRILIVVIEICLNSRSTD